MCGLLLFHAFLLLELFFVLLFVLLLIHVSTFFNIHVRGGKNRAEQLVLLAMQAIVTLSVLLVFASNDNIVSTVSVLSYVNIVHK